MAVTGIKSSKVTMYKMVSLPTRASGTKDSGMKASQMSYRSFTTGLNRIGATINSTIVINKQIRDALVQNLKLKDKEFEEEKKRFQKEKEEKNKIQKKSGTGFLGGVAEVAAKMSGGFLAGLAGLAGTLMKFVIGQSVLRWIANPANMQKLITIVQSIVNVVTFFSRFLRDNIVKMFEGLATMLDGKKNIFEKLGGFVTFISGFGAILGAALILKKPGMVLKGVGWVLKTLYDSLIGTKKSLKTRVGRGSSGSVGSAKGSRGGGKWGAVAKAASIAVPLAVGASMMGGKDEFSSGGDTGEPQLAKGGIATKPTRALIGEKGPEIVTPLENAKRMKNSGIQPLSSLGGMVGGKSGGDSKQAQKLSDLFMAPFKGIGAGILANISQVVSGLPGGQALTPILGNIITPVANSFGVPPSLVKSLTSKTQQKTKASSTSTGKGKDNISKIFGKGRSVKTDDKKFKTIADTSVLGLLTNMLGAVQVIGNKIGGGTTPDTTPGVGTPSDSIDQSSASAAAAGAQGAGSKDVSKNKGSSNVAAGQESQNTGEFSADAKDRKGGEVPFKWNGKDYKVVINATNGQYEVWDRNPLPFARPYDISKDSNAELKKKAFNQVRAYFVNNSPQKGIALKYITQDDIKNKQKLIDVAKKEQSASKGGWISGPMSGYPVSLDGGGSTAFIGHGTEWVGFKKAAEGGAFVVPFDTPATKNNPGLTGSRMRQAKQGGYALPGYQGGGKVKDPKGSGDAGLKTATSGGAVITSKYGPRWGRFHAGIDLAGVPIGTPITSLTGGKVLYASTYSGYGNTVDLEVKPGKVLRFAHLDGFLVKKGDVIQPGTKIGTLGNTGIGTGPHLHYEHRNKLSFGRDGVFNPLETGALSDITIGGKPIQGAKAGQQSEDQIKLDGQQEEQVDPFQALDDAVRKLNVSLGYAPQDTSVESATQAAAKAKDDKNKDARAKSAAAVGQALASNRKAQTAAPTSTSGRSANAVILPGGKTSVPVEVAWSSTTSLYQPKVSF
jgi:murein DD-endopeptidase MepM/ murein hydrolase activator NlpD